MIRQVAGLLTPFPLAPYWPVLPRFRRFSVKDMTARPPATTRILDLFLAAFEQQHGIALTLADPVTLRRLLVAADAVREELARRDPVTITIPHLQRDKHLRLTISRADFTHLPDDQGSGYSLS